MSVHAQINVLARRAIEHWGAGRLAEAAEGYAAAVALVHGHGLQPVADLHAQWAGVLDALGRLGEAVVQSEQALTAELAQGQTDATPSVKIARYFLADRLVRQGRHLRALELLAPSLAALPDDWLLATAQAEALLGAGRAGDAAAAAQRALANAPSDDKRAQLTERLAPALRG